MFVHPESSGGAVAAYRAVAYKCPAQIPRSVRFVLRSAPFATAATNLRRRTTDGSYRDRPAACTGLDLSRRPVGFGGGNPSSSVNGRATRRLQVMHRTLGCTDQCRLNDHSTRRSTRAHVEVATGRYRLRRAAVLCPRPVPGRRRRPPVDLGSARRRADTDTAPPPAHHRSLPGTRAPSRCERPPLLDLRTSAAWLGPPAPG
jgi:hypothetical protein